MLEKLRSEKSIDIITYISLAAVSAVFLFFFSLWTSPRNPHWYGCDASFFTLVGRGMLEGMVPYRDAYDLKGPYFFFIQALGQLIHKGHVGIFILQVLALFFSLVLIYKTGRMYSSRGKTLGIITFFLLAYISLLWGGNCLEEFTLPLNLLVIYLNFRYFTAPGEKKPLSVYLIAFVTGLCFTVMTFSKITAGAPLIGLCMGLFILMLIRRDLKTLGFYILYFIMGALLGLLPLLIYFGIKGSILRMLYCTFIFGFKRSSDLSKVLDFDLEVKLSGLIFSIVFCILHLVKIRKKSGNEDVQAPDTDNNVKCNEDHIIRDSLILTLAMSFVTYLVLHLGDGFIYYFITGMPCMITALILFVRIYDPLILFKNVRQSICWILIFVFVFHYAQSSVYTVKSVIHDWDEGFQEKYYNEALNMGALIPQYDRESVFSFDIDMQWYEINGILPCNRYMVNLQYFIALEPPIEQELFEFLDKTPPKWMICSNTLKDYLPQMFDIVVQKYDCVYTTDIGGVYLLRDQVENSSDSWYNTQDIQR